jgi:thiol:disulfide interchange protein|tara:strand:+ start:1097 stop:1609 length:513 start_codon:yes stop_codon:yes gene_type:complete
LPGIKSKEDIETILDKDAFTIEYDETLTTLDDMYSAILDLGYAPRLASDKGSNAGTKVVIGEVPQPIADALIQARAMSKILLVDFFAQWCIACKALDEQTLSSEKVQSALAGYIFVKVNTDQFPHSAVYYDVVGMPTLLVLDANGNETFRSVGSISAADLSEKLEILNPH